MGQETIYLLLAVTMFTTIVLAAYLLALRQEVKQQDPPIIVLPEAEGYYFGAGSAALSGDFENRLRRLVIPRLREIGATYDATVIEVIGHTDEIPLHGHGQLPSNLDAVLVPMFVGDAPAEPVAADNAGLGMARAVAVARFMRESGLSSKFTIIPLSAGPFLKPDDTALSAGEAVADEARRRIEVRLRRREHR
ncbi:MAG: hypothetical protein B7Y45_10850 [Sphingomonas sp. 28-66-16]|nr:MAG: hypothetical protein B7Y45_10850 [Sphingomonas sp. 28-66-16]